MTSITTPTDQAGQPSHEDVVAAIDTLTASFRYDPKERWLPAYTMLARVRRELRCARRPYDQTRFLFSVAIMSVWAYAYWRLMNQPTFPFWWFMALMAATGLASATAGAALNALAQRRHPLLKLQREIEEACKIFDEMAEAVAAKDVAA